MVNVVKHRRSSSTGETPSASDLEVGEIALNTADAKLFIKHTDGVVYEISGGGAGSLSAMTDTTITSLGDGELVVYDSTSSKWINQTLAEAGIAPVASPGLTGTPTAPTASAATNSTQIATTAYVTTAVSNLVDSAPGTLNTLNELAAALGDDANFSTTVTNSIATKLPLSGGTMSGQLVIADNDGGQSMLQVRNHSTTNTGSFTGSYTAEIRGATSGSQTHGMLINLKEANDSRRTLDIGDNNGVFASFVNGKLGLGTQSPSNKLEINSSNGSWRSSDYGGMYFHNTSDANHEVYIHSRSDGKISIGRVPIASLSGGSGGYAANSYDHLNIDTAGKAVFSGDVQAAGLYVGSTNTSYDFYNNGTTYLNGATTIDDNTQINGNLSITGTVDGVDLAAFKTAYDSHNHDGRYYTESEVNTRMTYTLYASQTLTSSNDLNSISHRGWYGWGSSDPTNAPADYGMLIDGTDGSQPQQLVQTYGGSSNKVSLYGRRKTSGTWDTIWTQYFSDHYHPNADTLTTARTINGVSFDGSANITVADSTKLPLAGGTMTGELQLNARLDVGDGTGSDAEIRIKKADNNVSDHIQFFNGTTRIGEIGCEDTTWLRINQETAKNIYTPRFIRADGGFFVDDTTKGINGSGNFIGGTITGASDANVSNWNTAYGWGDHAAAGYITSNADDSGTGSYTTSGTYWEIGRGTGSVAMTTNDGYGNANITFNHRSGVPDVNGAACRIETNVDSSAAGQFTFEVSSSAVTAGTAVGLTPAMYLGSNFADFPRYIRHMDDPDTYLDFHAADSLRVVTGNSTRLTTNSDGITVNDGAVLGSRTLTADGQNDVLLFSSSHSSGVAQGGAFHNKLRLFGGSGQSRDLQLWQQDSEYVHIGTSYSSNQLHFDSSFSLFEFHNRVIIDTDNQVDGALRIENNVTDTNNDFYFAQEIIQTLSGSQAATGDREQGGIYMDINSTNTGGDTSNEHRAYGIYLDMDSTGDADNVTGIYSNVTATPTTGQTTNVWAGYFWAEDNGGAGSVNNVYGIQSFTYSDNSNSDTDNMYAGYFKTYNAADSAAIGQAHGVYSEVEITSGSGDIYGNTFVYRAELDNNAGAQSNSTYLYYGNYAGTLPTTAWGVYIVDSVDNYFAGSLQVGDKIAHAGDTDTYFQFHGANLARMVLAGAEVQEWGADYTLFSDNDTVRLGTGSDFRMWFNGTDTVFRNYAHAGGSIIFQGEDTEGTNHTLLHMRNDTSSPFLQLYENGGERLRTLSGGVGVTGLTVGDVDANPHNAGGLQVSTTNQEKIVLSGSTNPYIRFQENTTDKAYIQWNSGGFLDFRNQENGQFKFQSGVDGQSSDLILIRHDTTTASGNDLGSINFGHTDGTPDYPTQTVSQLPARIVAEATETTGSGDDGARLRFFVKATNANKDTSSVEALRIDQNKAVTFYGNAIFNGTVTGISAGAEDDIFWENNQAVTSNYTITNGKNAMSAGPITINSGVTVTVGDGEAWTVV